MNNFEDQKFEGIDDPALKIPRGDYEGCSFKNCNFSDSDLSHYNFTECTFDACNLPMVKLQKTSLNDVKFIDCKMLGLDFEHCSEYLFTVYFEGSTLNFSSFIKRNLKKTTFRNCILHEVDFSSTDLTSAVFAACDLSRARFEQTNLEKADFRTSFNFAINPEINKLKKAKFTLDGLPALLEKYDLVIG